MAQGALEAIALSLREVVRLSTKTATQKFKVDGGAWSGITLDAVSG